MIWKVNDILSKHTQGSSLEIIAGDTRNKGDHRWSEEKVITQRENMLERNHLQGSRVYLTLLQSRGEREEDGGPEVIPFKKFKATYQ